MDVYFDFPVADNTAITVNPYTGRNSVPPHKHTYQEFVLITKGFCIHKYKGLEVTLIPGDVLLIPPHQEHSYTMLSDVTILNCQFFPERLGAYWSEMLDHVKLNEETPSCNKDLQKQWDSILQKVKMEGNFEKRKVHQADLNKQGIIHLTASETIQVESILNAMIMEQGKKKTGIEYMKPAYLQIILVILKRAQERQAERLINYSSRKRELIFDTLSYLDDHFAEKIDFSQIASDIHLSSSYFRAIFKDVTGLSPTDYLNRIRIVKSLEYLQSDSLSVAESAEKVGILDANYFSRLFKKIMGYSPRYFTNIR